MWSQMNIMRHPEINFKKSSIEFVIPEAFTKHSLYPTLMKDLKQYLQCPYSFKYRFLDLYCISPNYLISLNNLEFWNILQCHWQACDLKIIHRISFLVKSFPHMNLRIHVFVMVWIWGVPTPCPMVICWRLGPQMMTLFLEAVKTLGSRAYVGKNRSLGCAMKIYTMSWAPSYFSLWFLFATRWVALMHTKLHAMRFSLTSLPHQWNQLTMDWNSETLSQNKSFLP
jgi:hypothetical protein